MIQIPVVNEQGKEVSKVEIDENVLGGRIRPKLLKQAIVAFQANGRQNTSSTKSRGMVSGSTRKLYRQKGTGNARMGARRTNVRRGGGMAFRKGEQSFKQGMNKKMRRLARNNAILAKIQSESALVVDGLDFDAPSTKRFSSFLDAVGADRGCVFALDQANDVLYRSGRNIPKTDVRSIGEVNAYEILRRKKMILTKPAFEALLRDPVIPAGVSPIEAEMSK